MFNTFTLDKTFSNACKQLKLDPKVVLNQFMSDFSRSTSDVNIDIHNWRITRFPDKERDFFQIGAIDLKTLLYKLDMELTNALENTVSDVIKKTCFYITIEHFLLKIAESNDSFKTRLTTIGFDPDIIIGVWNTLVNKQKTGNKSKPEFSPSFIEFINTAYHKCIKQTKGDNIGHEIILSVINESEKLKSSWSYLISK